MLRLHRNSNIDQMMETETGTVIFCVSGASLHRKLLDIQEGYITSQNLAPYRGGGESQNR